MLSSRPWLAGQGPCCTRSLPWAKNFQQYCCSNRVSAKLSAPGPPEVLSVAPRALTFLSAYCCSCAAGRRAVCWNHSALISPPHSAQKTICRLLAEPLLLLLLATFTVAQDDAPEVFQGLLVRVFLPSQGCRHFLCHLCLDLSYWTLFESPPVGLGDHQLLHLSVF